MAISQIVQNSISSSVELGRPFVAKPIITSPANNASNVTDTQLITASPYLSLYGIAQANALFQISTSPTFAFINVASTITGSNTQFQSNASSGLVANTTTHFARVRYSDTSNNSSAFSDTIQFTTPALFPFNIEYLVVAGGGGGGGGLYHSGGGGAGGFRTGAGFSVTAGTTYTVTVGAGGNGGTTSNDGDNGSNSTFSTITSTGGGGGSNYLTAGGGKNGGSGGGGSAGGSPYGALPSNGGSGNTPSTVPSQGNNGGVGVNAGSQGAGGGGGAGGVGSDGTGTNGGNGGAGAQSPITGVSPAPYYAGGGGGSLYAGPGTAGSGGVGGGGAGSLSGSNQAGSGTPGTGGGGGGAERNTFTTGGSGGSGIIIIKIPNTQNATFTGGVTASANTTASAGNVIWSITATSNTNQFVTFI